MVTVGSVVRFEAKPGKEADFERLLKEESLLAAQREPDTTAWFAIRLGPSTFGVFDAFSDEEGRQAHFEAGVKRLENAPDLLKDAPVVEKVDILAAKLPS